MIHQTETNTDLASEDGQQICPSCGLVYTAFPGMSSSVCESCLLSFALGEEVADVREVPCKEPASGTVLSFGSYSVLEEIGRGGMGVIYRAIHRGTGAVVALKTVLHQYGGCAETHTRFEREAEAASSLHHPHVMPIYEVGHGDGDLPFFSMKLAESGTLHQLKDKYYGRWRQIAELMVKIADAVQHAHEHGVLHRDLKPANILFTADYEPLVTDFGLAKRIASSDILTQSCSVLGTPSYIAPEQAAGRTHEITVLTDIYGLGAIFYELLTGSPPFTGENPLDVLRQVLERSPKRPRRVLASVPQTLERICWHCLERVPTERYESAQALANDLKRWLNGREVTVSPIRTWPLAAPWFRRLNSFWFAVVLTLTAIFGIVWVSARTTRISGEITPASIAIEDWSADGSLSGFALRSADELKRGLARTSMFQFQGAGGDGASAQGVAFDAIAFGRSHNARVVLTGCVRRSGETVRLVMRLVSCATGEVVWRRVDSIPAERFDTVLPSIVEAAVSEIKAKWHPELSTAVRPLDHSPPPEAQKLFTRATELIARINQRDLDTAVRFLQRASEIDPHFTTAITTLAFARWVQADNYGEMEQIPLAMSAARQALAIDPNSVQAHRVIGSCYVKEGSLKTALEELWIALELDPQSAGCCQSLGLCLRDMGQPHRSIPWLMRAVKIDPSRGAFHSSLAESLAICGNDQQADAALARTMELDGEQTESLIDLGVLRTWQKRFGEARQIYAKVLHLDPATRYGLSLAAWIDFCDGQTSDASAYYLELKRDNSFLKDWEFYGAINPSSALAYLTMNSGKVEQARLLAEEAVSMDQSLLKMHPGNARILHDLAATYAFTGDTEQSLGCLRNAVSAGWSEWRSTEIDPRFSAIVRMPRFQEIMGRGSEKP